VKPACSTCHVDKHKGTLGSACETCHSVDAPFADAIKTFDHSTAAFALTGAHARTPCASCHRTPDYRVARFSSCSSCHTTPHAPKVSTVCAGCHTTETWRTKKFDHNRTAFPLVGKHGSVECSRCHTEPAARVKPAAPRARPAMRIRTRADSNRIAAPATTSGDSPTRRSITSEPRATRWPTGIRD
jgi:hypothetical protein